MLFDALGIKPDHIIEAQQAIQDMARIARETKEQLDRMEARIEATYEIVDYLERAHDDPAAIRTDYSELPSFDQLTPTTWEQYHSQPEIQRLISNGGNGSYNPNGTN